MFDTAPNEGERLTFFQIFSLKNWNVEIPIIQRDYAQGRKSSKEVREQFLSSLYQHLDAGKHIDLDFIYGSFIHTSVSTFIPLDGQQRLTTLFLLHWYLANRDNVFPSFHGVFSTSGKSNFTYETRVSSKEFCNALTGTAVDLNSLLVADKDEKNNLSKTIKDASWYFNSWNNDPSVKSMMVMLDDIHDFFSSTSGFYSKLTRDDDPIITFQFLNLKAFELTDDLYIKMNARGKLLSPFENFKAWLQNSVSEQKLILVERDWELNLDVKWMNMFWDYKGGAISDIDNSYYSFFKNVGLYEYIININKNDSKLPLDRELVEALDKRNNISLKSFEDNNYFQKGSLDFIFKSLNSLLEIGFDRLNLLLSSAYKEPSVKKNHDIAQLIVGKDNNPTLPYRVLVYALLLYINEVERDRNNAYELNFRRWMRVCYNLISNTYIQNPDNLSSAIQAVHKLSENKESIYEYLISPEADITFFNSTQRDEEILKAQLILSDNAWEQHLIEFEKHNYFNGQIGFILDISKGDTYLVDEFLLMARKAAAIFSPEILEHPDFIFHRAYLSKKKYFVMDGINSNFCSSNIGFREKEENWRKVLRNTEKLAAFKLLLNEITVGEEIQSLENIIAGYESTSWKMYFVKSPYPFQRCNKRIIRFDNNDIFLFKTTRLYGEHAELRTYSFYRHHIENKIINFKPFTNAFYFYNPRNESSPCFVLYGYKFRKAAFQLEIFYKGVLNSFEIVFFVSTNKATNEIVANELTKIGFTVYNDKGNLSIQILDEDTLLKKLNETTTLLQMLQ